LSSKPRRRIQIDFISFQTQFNSDFLSIYNGDSTAAPTLGTFSGTVLVGGSFLASTTNPSGCLTFQFTSNGAGNGSGWEANIICVEPCQTIEPFISSVPDVDSSAVITVFQGRNVDFTGDTDFSIDGTGATYSWDFDDGGNATGQNVSHVFNTVGLFEVTLTVTNTDPQGCWQTVTVPVSVLGPNVEVDQDVFTEEELVYDVLTNSPCAQISHITYSTGTDYGLSNNGIGCFFI